MQMRSLNGAMVRRAGSEALKHWNLTLGITFLAIIVGTVAWFVVGLLVRKRRRTRLDRTRSYLEKLEQYRAQVSGALGRLQSQYADGSIAGEQLVRSVKQAETEVKAAEIVISTFRKETDRLVRRLGRKTS